MRVGQKSYRHVARWLESCGFRRGAATEVADAPALDGIHTMLEALPITPADSPAGIGTGGAHGNSATRRVTAECRGRRRINGGRAQRFRLSDRCVPVLRLKAQPKDSRAARRRTVCRVSAVAGQPGADTSASDDRTSAAASPRELPFAPRTEASLAAHHLSNSSGVKRNR